MYKSTSLAKMFLKRSKNRENINEQYRLTQKNVEKIKKIFIKQIKYPEFKEAYEYVDRLFPMVNVKEIMIYKVAYKDLVRIE